MALDIMCLGCNSPVAFEVGEKIFESHGQAAEPEEDSLETQTTQQNPVVTNPNAKVIKRYQNRKLYDTQQSCYVTLEDIARMIRNNEDVVVIDNKTKKDITASTLTQIIFEAEKKARNYISLDTLKEIIQTGTGSISSYLEKVLGRPAGATSEAAGNGGTVNASAANQDVGALLDTTNRSFDDIQKQLEDRLNRAREAGEIGGVQDRINQLHQKLTSLDNRLREFGLEQ
jgi:polyhydroxyalkanoate synthesis repressor PhaR